MFLNVQLITHFGFVNAMQIGLVGVTYDKVVQISFLGNVNQISFVGIISCKVMYIGFVGPISRHGWRRSIFVQIDACFLLVTG